MTTTLPQTGSIYTNVRSELLTTLRHNPEELTPDELTLCCKTCTQDVILYAAKRLDKPQILICMEAEPEAGMEYFADQLDNFEFHNHAHRAPMTCLTTPELVVRMSPAALHRCVKSQPYLAFLYLKGDKFRKLPENLQARCRKAATAADVDALADGFRQGIKRVKEIAKNKGWKQTLWALLTKPLRHHANSAA